MTDTTISTPTRPQLGFNLMSGHTTLGFQLLSNDKVLLSINSTQTIISLSDFKLFLSEIQFRLTDQTLISTHIQFADQLELSQFFDFLDRHPGTKILSYYNKGAHPIVELGLPDQTAIDKIQSDWADPNMSEILNIDLSKY